MSRNRAYCERAILLCAGFCVLLVCTSGCKDRNNDARDRIDRTKKQLEAHAPNSLALAELGQATPESLRQPKIVFARLVEQRKTVALLIEWIEFAPTVEAVGVRCSETEPWQMYPLDGDTVQANRQDAERGFVLYNVVVSWDPKGDSWLALAPDVRVGKCHAALFRDDQLVSNVVPIEYIRGPTLSTQDE